MKTKVALFLLLIIGFIQAQKRPDLARFKTTQEKLSAWEKYCKALKRELSDLNSCCELFLV